MSVRKRDFFSSVNCVRKEIFKFFRMVGKPNLYSSQFFKNQFNEHKNCDGTQLHNVLNLLCEHSVHFFLYIFIIIIIERVIESYWIVYIFSFVFKSVSERAKNMLCIECVSINWNWPSSGKYFSKCFLFACFPMRIVICRHC